MEYDPSQLNRPEQPWRFDEDTSLLERAEQDERLANYLHGLRVARQRVEQNPGNPTFTTLLEVTEQATGEYVIGRLGWRAPDPTEQGRP